MVKNKLKNRIGIGPTVQYLSEFMKNTEVITVKHKTQKATAVSTHRFTVTVATYVKCKWMARNLSTATAVMVRIETPAQVKPTNQWATLLLHQAAP